MSWQSVRIRAEVAWIRARSTLRVLVRLAAIGIVLLAATNLFAAPVLGYEAVAPYRLDIPIFFDTGSSIFLMDAVAILGGSAVAWFV